VCVCKCVCFHVVGVTMSHTHTSTEIHAPVGQQSIHSSTTKPHQKPTPCSLPSPLLSNPTNHRWTWGDAACIQRALLLNPKDATARRLATEVMTRMAQGRTYPLLPSYVDAGGSRPTLNGVEEGEEEEQQQQEEQWGQGQEEEGIEEEEEEGDDRPEEERYLTWCARVGGNGGLWGWGGCVLVCLYVCMCLCVEMGDREASTVCVRTQQPSPLSFPPHPSPQHPPNTIPPQHRNDLLEQAWRTREAVAAKERAQAAAVAREVRGDLWFVCNRPTGFSLFFVLF
jgi:hypothetical protein